MLFVQSSELLTVIWVFVSVMRKFGITNLPFG